MNGEQIATLLVLALAVVSLLMEWLPIGLVAILAPLTLVICRVVEPEATGLLLPEEMWAGLSHKAVVAVAAMFVVSVGVSRTGAVAFLGDALTGIAASGRRRIVAVMMLIVAVMSAFVNNTTVVLVCLPVVLTMCERMDHPPSRYLIPLSFASIFGGMMTMVGTSTNIVVAEVGSAADSNFQPGMWDFFPVGVLFVVVGVAYMTLIGIKLLPDRVALSMTLSRGIPTEYVTEAEVLPDSSLAGRSLGEVAEKYRLRVLQLVRRDIIEIPAKDIELEVGDVLLVKGGASQIIDLSSGAGTSLLPGVDEADIKARRVGMTLAEVIVPPSSRWIDRRVDEIGFRSRYRVSVIAVQRHGHHVRQKVGELRVEPADMLLVQGSVESLRNLRASENLILVEGVQDQVKERTKAPIALAILAGFVALVSTGTTDIATGAVLAAASMVLTRCLTVQQAYSAPDWNILFLLAGFLAMGTALDKVGLARMAADGLVGLLQGTSPWVIVGTVYLFVAFMSDLLSNQAVATLMIPIVVKASASLGWNSQPLLMTVAFAASAAFLTPVGYQTNLLVYAPGGYRFRDFIVVGLPLRFAFAVIAAIAIPMVYSTH
ncbi:MAG: SLC13 family permease [Planctomycetes bacterium]|nr:SLC13 family permease [Planctomycetota bacterium]